MDFDTLKETRNLLLKWSVTEEEIGRKFGYEFMKWNKITAYCRNAFMNDSFLLVPRAALFNRKFVASNQGLNEIGLNKHNTIFYARMKKSGHSDFFGAHTKQTIF